MTAGGDLDERALAPGLLVKAAAAVQAVCGLYVALSAVQLLSSLTFYGPLLVMQYLNWALLVLGVGQVVLAAGVVRLRARAAIAATVLGWLLAPTVTAWAGTAISAMIFSLMQAGAVMLAWGAAVLSPFTVGAALRAERARKALAADGMDLGL